MVSGFSPLLGKPIMSQQISEIARDRLAEPFECGESPLLVWGGSSFC